MTAERNIRCAHTPIDESLWVLRTSGNHAAGRRLPFQCRPLPRPGFRDGPGPRTVSFTYSVVVIYPQVKTNMR